MTTTNHRRARWALGVSAALLLVPGLLTACSSDTPDSESTTAGKGTNSAFFSCMREKGYDAPEPTGGERGVNFTAPDGVDLEQYNADIQACAKTSGAQAGDAKPVKGADKKTRQVAECIRENGFSDYPDDPEKAASFVPSDEDTFGDVAQTCDEKYFGKSGEVVEQ